MYPFPTTNMLGGTSMKQSVFTHMENISFHANANVLLALMKPYLERVELVKDYIGVRDVLCLPEKESQTFRHPHVLSLNCEISREDHIKNLSSFEENYMFDFSAIQKELIQFFVSTDRTLYVYIGFSSSQPTKEDYMKIYDDLSLPHTQEFHAMRLQLRKFPDWYEGFFPYHKLLQESVELASEEEGDRMDHIHKALLTGDKKSFMLWSKK